MVTPSTSMPWVGSLLWLLALALASFGVSWIAANRQGMRRTSYVAVLTLVTAGLTVGYVGWLGVGARELLLSRWGWGLLAAPVSAAFLVVGMTKLPVVRQFRGARLGAALLWEAVVYGVAEGVLLSALPVLMTWQLVHSLGWSGQAGAVARWTLPIVASVAVIVVHHLGYWEYRNRLLVPISLGCGLLSVGYLVTASPVGPTLGHVLCHASSLLHGAELPPHAHAASTPSAPIPSPR
jgi:hypothetical protein